LRPSDLIAIQGDIPANLEIATLDFESLPPHWYATRDQSLKQFGDEWIRGGATAALLVPSAAIRGEWNILLNPAHAGFPKIVFQKPEPFEFDLRMFR
jgi:RES domain-containing protein